MFPKFFKRAVVALATLVISTSAMAQSECPDNRMCLVIDRDNVECELIRDGTRVPLPTSVNETKRIAVKLDGEPIVFETGGLQYRQPRIQGLQVITLTSEGGSCSIRGSSTEYINPTGTTAPPTIVRAAPPPRSSRPLSDAEMRAFEASTREGPVDPLLGPAGTGPGNLPWLATMNPGRLPPEDTPRCPQGTIPGVKGTADPLSCVIKGVRVHGLRCQSDLDGRRALAIAPEPVSEWDGRWVKIDGTDILGLGAAGVTCVPEEYVDWWPGYEEYTCNLLEIGFTVDQLDIDGDHYIDPDECVMPEDEYTCDLLSQGYTIADLDTNGDNEIEPFECKEPYSCYLLEDDDISVADLDTSGNGEVEPEECKLENAFKAVKPNAVALTTRCLGDVGTYGWSTQCGGGVAARFDDLNAGTLHVTWGITPIQGVVLGNPNDPSMFQNGPIKDGTNMGTAAGLTFTWWHRFNEDGRFRTLLAFDAQGRRPESGDARFDIAMIGGNAGLSWAFGDERNHILSAAYWVAGGYGNLDAGEYTTQFGEEVSGFGTPHSFDQHAFVVHWTWWGIAN